MGGRSPKGSKGNKRGPWWRIMHLMRIWIWYGHVTREQRGIVEEEEGGSEGGGGMGLSSGEILAEYSDSVCENVIMRPIVYTKD